MASQWLVLLPPLVVMIASFISKRLHLSLFIGLLSAALITTNGSIIPSIQLLITRLFNQITDVDNIYLYSFLFILGIITLMLELSGGARAFAHALSKRIHSPKTAQLTSIGISFIFCIDDYLSCLTTGSIMRSLTDKFKIARAKLAYLVHSLTSPLVMIAPISTWIAMITSQLDQAGISSTIQAHTKIIGDPYLVYVSSIPFVFYSIILVFSVLFIVLFGISFGPMAQQEKIALSTGNLWGNKKALDQTISEEKNTQGSVIDLILPIAILMATFLFGLLYMGDFWLFGGTRSFIAAIQHTQNTSLVLLATSIITFFATIFLGYSRGTLSSKSIITQTIEGIKFMIPSIGIVFLAGTLGIMMRLDLQTGTYLANLLSGKLPIIFLPICFYLVSLATSLVTGSAWGTIGLMVPIGVQMTISFMGVATPVSAHALTLLYPVLGAIFSGAVCGNHISPVAELMVMSATSTGAYPLDHAITQFWYAFPVVLGSIAAYITIGLLNSWSFYGSLISALGIGLITYIFVTCIFIGLYKFVIKNDA